MRRLEATAGLAIGLLGAVIALSIGTAVVLAYRQPVSAGGAKQAATAGSPLAAAVDGLTAEVVTPTATGGHDSSPAPTRPAQAGAAQSAAPASGALAPAPQLAAAVTPAPATAAAWASVPPVTSPPQASPPVSTPPVTSPPASTPPVTSPPVTAPPVTSPPTTVTTQPPRWDDDPPQGPNPTGGGSNPPATAG